MDYLAVGIAVLDDGTSRLLGRHHNSVGLVRREDDMVWSGPGVL